MAKRNLHCDAVHPVAFTDHPELAVPLLLMFLSFYLVTLLEDVGVIILIQIHTQLHTPKCFSLSHVALLDACYTVSSALRPWPH